MKSILICLSLLMMVACNAKVKEGKKMVDQKLPEKVKVMMKTNFGEVELELDAKNAPLTVKNFLAYAESGFYNETIFHRVIRNFMIQGGGFNESMTKKGTKEPIKNEADNGLENETGTIAMARTNIVDSATAQFFINTKDNGALNHRDKSSSGFGYAVFGKVTKGMDVVKRIEMTPTGSSGHYQDVPTEAVKIESMTRL